ncbi:MAG TPA: glutathione S-transferase family protein [Pseudolabrys sp.]|nr:glutathione S-transferase family protein [Pseudolabrys sp.]
MPLVLHFHPLSSFCQKVLIALYESGTPFSKHMVDLTDEAANAAFKKLWPVGKFPVLRDETADRVIPESTTIIEYLAQNYPGQAKLIPDDPEAAFEARAQDRFYDLSIHVPMQKIITDRLRPKGQNDPFGVEQARGVLQAALGIADSRMAERAWAAGETFGIADCAAAPTLFYVDMAVAPLAGSFDNVAAYLDRLTRRPSFARALDEAKPYLKYVPM